MLKSVINKLIVKRLIQEVVNTGYLDLVDEFIAPDYFDHTLAADAQQGVEGYKRHLSAVRDTYGGFQVIINFQLAVDDFVVTRLTAQGMHDGVFLDLPPSGRFITLTGINIDRLANGLIVEHWGEADTLAALFQMGARILPPD